VNCGGKKWGEASPMLRKEDEIIPRFGKMELVDKEISFIAFNRRDT